mgnify:CR=1 FL=1
MRFDDRGVGRSTLPEGMPHYGPSIKNETMDVRHLVEWLAAQPTVDPAAVGIVGWDTGGWVAVNTAAGLHRDVAFIVLLSMPGLPLAEVMSAQLWQQLAAAPVDQEQARTVLRAYRTLLDVGKDPQASDEELRELVVQYLAAQRQLSPGNQRPVTEQEIAEGQAVMASPAMRRNLRFEPRMILPRLHCPVLAVGGTADVEVPPAVHLPEIEAAVQRTGGEIELVDIENVNHRLQPVDPEKVVDSSRIRATVDPRAMRVVTDWIQAVAGPVPPPAEAQDQ